MVLDKIIVVLQNRLNLKRWLFD